ncbi:Predicted DNA-binding transcriptional regulator YafY, contains an HTH and WYL domains [Andreprevotia lacus DSM 23236]|jgi:predicted DNA-binding transcriptional regulator YafY|uniref:Predicted DNA-binding transcriptional regulator YafY, contains an HTH and WYL domains n=1 Tax=Andreprevotia lacus DSM 23236 TaxID=1121001 RepID=A0A1W1XZD0_9NEIS|nr:YafY family protein [Andreprevotia lacus]SMC29235.1 Predicted DNA-binding transcriptional regulator YafY, contains an HTH and WYL domains [Andreprevotia lacus DSM 23236]
MSRAARLLDLIQCLRRHRRPVTAAALADELEVSVRTLYRDIQTLIAQGAPIQGEAGIGYVLRPGFLLPPLMFGDDEIEALVLGARMVMRDGDPALARAAQDALAKIVGVLPVDLRERVDATGLIAAPVADPGLALLGALRMAIRNEHKLQIRYRDGAGQGSLRIVWPLALAFFDRVRVLVAWCELRQDFRSFRTDRIAELSALDERYPQRRRVLLKRWREREKVADPS